MRRYKCDKPGELIDIDIKEPGKFERIAHRIIGDRTARAAPLDDTAATEAASRNHRHVDLMLQIRGRSTFDYWPCSGYKANANVNLIVDGNPL